MKLMDKISPFIIKKDSKSKAKLDKLWKKNSTFKSNAEKTKRLEKNTDVEIFNHTAPENYLIDLIKEILRGNR